jgi:hypothetical protein
MLGFGDLGVTLAYWSCLGATALCVALGLRFWNREEAAPPPRYEDDATPEEEI